VALLKLLATAALSVFVIACGSTPAAEKPDPARQTCEAEARGKIAFYSQTLTLAAALPTTAGATAHWEYTRNGPNGPRPLVSRWSALPAGQKVVFCYFDGDFANYSPPSHGATRVFERGLVIATEGEAPRLDHIGPKASTPLEAP
jgi:hypothetical protein